MRETELILEALSQRKDAVFFHLSEALSKAFPKRSMVETEDGDFDPLAFAGGGQCECAQKSKVHSQMATGYDAAHHTLVDSSTNAWHEVNWRESELDVVTIGVQGAHCRDERNFVIADSEETARAFVLACCEWNAEVRGEVLVFSGGWYKDEDLYHSIQKTTLQSLVLEGALKEEIESDFRSFLAARETYRKHGIPWKRGVLFLGPPGNGKTHAIKGLVNLLDIPCLYVRTFQQQYSTEQEMIRQVFARARTTAPCLLVLEDLDSILNDENRSYFLNELDGFASNEGILTIATTNHPERLDPAILDRPSRFDRKYTFHLPDLECRTRYLALQNEGLEPALRLAAEDVSSLAAATEEFSYAYLKELVLSSMMKWISSDRSEPMPGIMASQVEALRSQIQTPEPEIAPVQGFEFPPQMKAYMSRWTRKR